MSRGTPGFAGIVGIVAMLLGGAGLMTLVTGQFGHWPFVILGIVVGLWAVQSAHR